MTSGIANRLSFAGWAVLAAVGFGAAVRGGAARESIAEAGLAAAGIALILFAGLVALHREAVEDGVQAVAGVSHPVVASPLLPAVAGAALLAAGGFVLGRRRS